MKKLLLFKIFTISFFVANAQWAGFNNNGGDNLWSNDANWAFPSGTTTLATGQTISIYKNPTEATLDENYTAKSFNVSQTKENDFVINSLNAETLTIDIQDATKGNNDTGTIALESKTTVATNFTLNCNVTFANSVTPDANKGFSVIYINNAASEIIFSESKTVTFGGTASSSFRGLGTATLNGTIAGANDVFLGGDTKVSFGSATSDVSGFTGIVTLANNSEITFNSNGTSIVSDRLLCNGTDAIATFNTANVFKPDEIKVSTSSQANRGVNLNVNQNQTFNKLILKGDNSFCNLTIANNVTSIVFSANIGNWSSTADFNIYGFKENVLKFGNDDSSFTYLANIHIADGEHVGESVVLDSDGYLILQSTVATTNNVTILDFSVYPNPTNDVINVQAAEKLVSVVLYDLVGNKVLQSTSNQIKVNALSRGVYILKAFAEGGNQATQKIVIE